MKSILLAAMALLPLCATAQQSLASEPPISLVVGYAAGGSVDMVARKYATRMQALLGRPVVVENRGGASGAVAANAVKNARPDGAAIYFVASPTVSITPAFSKTTFDPIKDFVPAGAVVKYSNVLLVNTESPFKSVAELVQYGKENPQKVTYGSAGTASSNHLSGAMLARHVGVEMVHVPYKGNAPAVMDLIADRITLVFDANNNAINQINAGRVRPLAVTSALRNSQLPDVPTMMEAGLKDFKIENWIGLLLPAGASPELVRHLDGVNQKIVNDPDFIKEMQEAGYDMDGASPAELSRRIAEDYQRYQDLAGGMKLD